DKKSIEASLKDDEVPLPVRRVLQLRLNGGGAAAKKLSALLSTVGKDHRVRGAFKFHAASTGRWGGSRFQPQNLKRPDGKDPEEAIGSVPPGDLERVRQLGNPLSIIGDLGRSLICAAPGKTLVGADFSSIESRVLAWAAHEKWKLDSYRRYDATHDP